MKKTKQQFVESAAPEYWYTYAIELADTADGVYRASNGTSVAYVYEGEDGSKHAESRSLASRPVLLLYGLALENLIKGILISEDPMLLKDGRLDKSLLVHDLTKLAKRLGTISLDNKELSLLEVLSEAIPYYGRYPVPRHSQELLIEKHVDEQFYEHCKSLFQRLEVQLYKLNYNGLAAPEGVRFPKLRLTNLDEKVDFATEKVETDWRVYHREFLDAKGTP